MDDYAKDLVNGYRLGKELAAKSLEIGKRFLGCWGVCEALGLERDSMKWKGAEIGAWEIFSSREIWVDGKGAILACEMKGA